MAIDKGAIAAQYGVTAAVPKDSGLVPGHASSGSNTMVAAISSREVQRVQAQFLTARMFPRDAATSMARILDSCKRPGLADKAEYSYKRGKAEDGKDNYVTGASIKLAEVLAQCWGNVDFGINELENSDGRSKVEAYCVDLETNTSRRVTYEVPHLRVTKSGTFKLTDPRDIYEMIANRGARLLRGCILGIIPGDVQEAALTECKATIKRQLDESKAQGKEAFAKEVKKMLAAFAKLSVTQEQLEQILAKPAAEWEPEDLERLRGIGTTIRDGEAKISDYLATPEEEEAPAPITEAQRAELMNLASSNPSAVGAALADAGLPSIKHLNTSQYEAAKHVIEDVLKESMI